MEMSAIDIDIGYKCPTDHSPKLITNTHQNDQTGPDVVSFKMFQQLSGTKSERQCKKTKQNKKTNG